METIKQIIEMDGLALSRSAGRNFKSTLLVLGLLLLPFGQLGCSAEDVKPSAPLPPGSSDDDDTSNNDTLSTSGPEGDTSSTYYNDTGTEVRDTKRCLVEVPPPSWCIVKPQPACGDGLLNVDGEECDDCNTVPGDGCTGTCKLEKNWDCPIPPAEGNPLCQPCVSTLICGNGVKDPGEVCDDGNASDGDGCNATCVQVDPDWECLVPGEPCVRIVFCGDRKIKGSENCDDGNATPGDGCSDTCQTEDGWYCPKPGEPCVPADRCGDGKLTPTIGEVCDDGNVTGGDGCTADCRAVEADYLCLEPGQPCEYIPPVCGDGILAVGTEVCDDGNTTDLDGCSANCLVVEDGYQCPFPGAPCFSLCGDGIKSPTEDCDDNNLTNLDGCSDTCQWEEGWACTGTVGVDWECHQTKCGDGNQEGTEGCEDGNEMVGDGCYKCQKEPTCPVNGQCTSVCGDGLIVSPEICDDGNAVGGDGCSASCQPEPGFKCEQPALGSTLIVPIVLRDFTVAHQDFQFPGDEEGDVAYGLLTASKGLVRDTLDNTKKPVFIGTDNQYVANGLINSATSFDTWYRDPADPKATVVTDLILYDDGAGNYVNRYGSAGQQWERFGEEYDGNPVFFPLDDFDGITSSSEYDVARIPPSYFGQTESMDEEDCAADEDCNHCWPPECVDDTECTTLEEYSCYSTSPKHNFHFTTQVIYWFKYVAGEEYELTFVGDDDLWVFLNGKLALDLGGIHIALEDTLTINQTTAAQFDLQDGNLYEIMVFHAERETYASTYKLTLSGFNTNPSECNPECGDGVVSPGEECDNGTEANTGEYGGCNPDCTRAPYCGDGITQPGEEDCDDGINKTPYGDSSGAGGCAPGCVAPQFCGDGIVQTAFGETCDDTFNDGGYAECAPGCLLGPWCGDGIPQTEFGEQCDDGLNDGLYNNCAPGCVLGPYCGDSIINGPEDCDDGNTVDGDGCNSHCLEDGCGDGIVTPPEQCDNGVDNTGGYGGCAPDCTFGPRCGDGVVQKEFGEDCDDGTNAGDYGGCGPNCKVGPYCGDNILQPIYEECDDANDPACSEQCKIIQVITV